MKRLCFRIFLSVLLIVSLTPQAQAAPTGCPSTWKLEIGLKPGVQPVSVKFSEYDEAFVISYQENTGQLAEALKNIGSNISVTVIQETTADNLMWYNLSAKMTMIDGYFSNSFEIKPDFFVTFNQLFKIFSGGKTRVTYIIETKDCPGNPGYFSSTPVNLPVSKIFNDKLYDIENIATTYFGANFKDVELIKTGLSEWNNSIRSSLSAGRNPGWNDTPWIQSKIPISFVTTSGGNPPCVNYVNRGWKASDKDCFLEIYVPIKENNEQIYYLVDKVDIESPILRAIKEKNEADARAAAELKAKQEADDKAAAELKAKQDADAKAAAELKAKQEADVKAAADKIIQDAKLKAAKILASAKAATTKRTTITCIKGKLTKKVTAVKPVCPKGYKKK
jgi:organic radical activating enzyme